MNKTEASFPPRKFFFKLDNGIKINLEKLSRKVADIDYEVVIANRKHLKGLFGHLDDWWPSNCLTREENYQALLWHEQQFKDGSSFAYSIIVENKYIGCLYIYFFEEVKSIVKNPDKNKCYVFLWTTKNSYDSGLDGLIFHHIQEWSENHFKGYTIEYPGRNTPILGCAPDTASWILYEDNVR